jgi:hypothetical protein
MAQITIYAQGPINWDTTDGWNTASGGGGTAYTDPQNGVDTFICNLNGKVVTLNKDVTVDQITATDGTGYLSINGTRTLTVAAENGILYSGTSTSGMVRYTTGANLTINGEVHGSSTGYPIVGSGSGVLSISNAGGRAIRGSASNRIVTHGSTGNLTIVGDIYHSAASVISRTLFISRACTASITGNIYTYAGYGIYQNAAATTTIVGNATAREGGGYLLYNSSGSMTLDGEMEHTAGGVNTVYVASGTFNWIGSRTLAAGKEIFIEMSAGQVNLATAAGRLLLQNSGTFVIFSPAAARLVTSAAGGTASIVNQTSTSYAAILGGSAANKAIIQNFKNLMPRPFQIGV